jgi:multidrug resistance efflux pump
MPTRFSTPVIRALSLLTLFLSIAFAECNAFDAGDVEIRQPLLRHPERVDLSFPVPGRIRELHFEEGDVVDAGKVLSTLENDRELSEFKLKKARSEAQELLASARARAKVAGQGLAQARRGNDLKEGAIPAQELRRLELELEVANAELLEKETEQSLLAIEANVAKAVYESTILRAPFSGTITRKLLSSGSAVDGLKPIGQLIDTKTIRVEGYVGIQDVRKIKPGQKVLVTNKSGETFTFQLRFVDISAQQVQKLVRVWGQTTCDKKLVEGEEVTATIVLEDK